MVFFWGLSFIIVDIAMEFVPSLSVALYRLIIASISITIINVIYKNKGKDEIYEEIEIINNKNSLKRYWSLIIIASITGISGYLFTIYTAVGLIGPSLPSFTDCLLSPIFIAFISLVIFKEKLNRKMIIGFVIASIGSYLLITGGNIRILIFENPNFIGYILALLSPVFWSTYTISIKKIKEINKRNSDFRNLSYITYFGCLELFILILLTNQLFIFLSNILNLILFLCALYLGLGAFIIGYYIWNFSLKKLKSSKVASFLYIQPFITLLFSFLFQRSDPISLLNVVGGIIILISVLIIDNK